MSGPYDERLAKLAYRAHNVALRAEEKLPPWEELPTRVQIAWEVAAEVIWRHALRLRPRGNQAPCGCTPRCGHAEEVMPGG